MIVKEYFTIKSRDFTRQYSDKGVYIERDGTLYSEAIDPKELEREYAETDIPIEGETGGLTVTDTLEMLVEMGVDVDE